MVENKPYFGEFECYDCNKKWKSAWTYKGKLSSCASILSNKKINHKGDYKHTQTRINQYVDF